MHGYGTYQVHYCPTGTISSSIPEYKGKITQAFIIIVSGLAV
jgi:hypothetical protein